MTELLQRELWTSWASLLRSYSAVHSLGRDQHAVVEVSPELILLRYGLREARFTHSSYTAPDGSSTSFALTENGRACVGEAEDEMDLFAERLASAIITV